MNNVHLKNVPVFVPENVLEKLCFKFCAENVPKNVPVFVLGRLKLA